MKSLQRNKTCPESVGFRSFRVNLDCAGILPFIYIGKRWPRLFGSRERMLFLHWLLEALVSSHWMLDCAFLEWVDANMANPKKQHMQNRGHLDLRFLNTTFILFWEHKPEEELISCLWKHCEQSCERWRGALGYNCRYCDHRPQIRCWAGSSFLRLWVVWIETP